MHVRISSMHIGKIVDSNIASSMHAYSYHWDNMHKCPHIFMNCLKLRFLKYNFLPHVYLYCNICLFVTVREKTSVVHTSKFATVNFVVKGIGSPYIYKVSRIDIHSSLLDKV